MNKFQLILFLVLITIGEIAIAQDTSSEEESLENYSINDLYIDYAVPDISAFTMLGIAEEQIVRPGNLKQFSAGILNFLSSGTDIQTGFATEFSPLNFNKVREEDWWKRKFRWDNFSLSLATVTNDSLGTLLASGIKWVPINNSEPFGKQEFNNEVLNAVKSIYEEKELMENLKKEEDLHHAFLLNLLNNNLYNLQEVLTSSFSFEMDGRFEDHEKTLIKGGYETPIEKFEKDLTDALEGQSIVLTDVDKGQISSFAAKYVEFLNSSNTIKEIAKNKILELKSNFKKINWYRGGLLLSGGLSTRSIDGKYESLKFRNLSFIISGAIGIPLKKFPKTNAQLIIQGKYDSSLIEAVEFDNKFSLGSRFLIGNADNRLSLECIYSNAKLNDLYATETFDNIRYLKYVLGIELLVTKGTYLELAVGGQKFFEGESGTLIIPSLAFKHALQTKKRFN